MRTNLRAILDSLFISKVRLEILNLFYTNSRDKSFHIRGVVREIKEEINAVRRELLRLESIGLLKSQKKGNRIYYLLNIDFVLYPEILSIILKTSGLGAEVIKSLDKLGSVKYAFLTKSYIQGLRDDSSNIDFMIIGDIDLNVLNDVVQRAERQLGIEINYSVLKDSEFSLRKKRRDPFIAKVLTGSKIMLLGDEDELVS